MPNRILKESICTSEEIDKLSPLQETVFYRLIVNCDDFGRFDARPKILKSKLFPLKDIRVEQIEAALEALSSAELVILYEVDGKPFLQMKTWDRHQRVRAKVSKYPAPADTCCQMSADGGKTHTGADKCARNPIQSNPNPIPNPNAETENINAREEDDDEDDGFEAFWNAFPVKYGDIRQAYFEYLGVLQSGVSADVLLDAATKQAAEKGRFMPGAEKWLRNKGWTEPDTHAAEEKPAGSAGRSTTTFMDVLNRRREA